MVLSYTLRGRTADQKTICGNVMIEDLANISATGDLRYSICAYHAYCDGVMYYNTQDNPGLLFFAPGQYPNTIENDSAEWRIGDWYNGATGIWFRHANGAKYETDRGFGRLDHYQNLPARIELCADMVQGPFNPVGRVWLIWNPQFFLHE